MEKSHLLGAVFAIGVLIAAPNARAILITVPGTLENTEGGSNNGFPFNAGSFNQTNMRYQQIYSASEFSAAGIVDEIRYRVDESGTSFSTSGIDIRIDLAYAATTVANRSTIFSENIGAGLVTVLDTPNLSLSGTQVVGVTPNPFDIVINVDNLFVYDPSMGDLLVDIYMRNAPITTTFDATNSSKTGRIFATSQTGGVNATSGLTTAPGLVTI